MPRGELKVFSGTTHPELAAEVCSYLKRPLGKASAFKFSNDNIFVAVNENVRDADVFILQTSCPPVNDGLMELLIFIDACRRASAGRITAVIPYFPYARSDKKDQPRVPITARLVSELLSVAGADRVITIDLHAPQIQGFFSIPLDHLTARHNVAKYFKKKGTENKVVLAPDAGSANFVEKLANLLDLPYAIVDKRRIGNEERATARGIIGAVAGKDIIYFDDEISTAGSLQEVVRLLKEEGAGKVYASCTHPVLSGPAIDRIKKTPLEELVVTNSIPIPQKKRLANLTVLSLGSLLAETIKRVHNGESISALFG